MGSRFLVVHDPKFQNLKSKRGTPMSIYLMSEVWCLQVEHPQLIVLLALTDHADDRGRVLSRVPYLAWKTGYSERMVQHHLRRLEEMGILTIKAHREGGRGHFTEYLIDLRNAPRRQPFTMHGGHPIRLPVPVPVPNSKPFPSAVRKKAVQGSHSALDHDSENKSGRSSASLPHAVSFLAPTGAGPATPGSSPGEKPIAAESSNLINSDIGRVAPSPSNAEREPNSVTRPVPKPQGPALRTSPYLTMLIYDFSHELGDPGGCRENATSALRLWRRSGLSEEEFGLLCHYMKRVTRKHQSRPYQDPMRNKMAYFFACLRNHVDRLNEHEGEDRYEDGPA